jgi:periplasmic copper chaperone A
MATHTAPARFALAAAAVIALAVAACSSSGATAAPSAAASAAVPAASAAASGGMSVTGAWVRQSALVAGADAAYLVITNGTGQDDALISVSSPLAATVEIHETVAVQASAMPAASGGMGGGMASGSPMAGGGMGDGMMVMRPVDSVPIAAGATVELKPGGYHIMIVDPKEQPAVGSTVELTLTFQKAPPVTVTAEVRGL